jgi:ABC-type transport system involved in multi-copper enzyme maturation permease subunit
MSTQLLHYRPWQGKLRSAGWSVWPIARVALGTLFRRRLFWFLYSAGLLLFLMFFFGTYLLDWAETRIPAERVQVGRFSADPERMARLLRRGLRILNGSHETFAYFFVYQGSVVMIVLALAGAVLVGNDYTLRSLSFYLAKPIGRWHFILGKCLAVGVVVNLLTTLPALLLFLQHGLEDWGYITNPDYFALNQLGSGPAGVPLLLGILGFGLVLTVFLSLVLVATASWVRRTMPLVMVWTTLFLFLRLLAAILVDGLKYDVRWRLIDLWNDLCLLGFACLGFGEDWQWQVPQPKYWEAAVTLGTVCLVSLCYLHFRTRSVEVAKG